MHYNWYFSPICSVNMNESIVVLSSVPWNPVTAASTEVSAWQERETRAYVYVRYHALAQGHEYANL